MWIPKKAFTDEQEHALAELFKQQGVPPEKISNLVWRLERVARISCGFRENQIVAQKPAEIRAEIDRVQGCIANFLKADVFSLVQALHCSLAEAGTDTGRRLSSARQLGGGYAAHLEGEIAQLAGSAARVEAELSKLLDGIDALPERVTGRGRKPGSKDEVINSLVYAVCSQLFSVLERFPDPSLFYKTISIIEGINQTPRPFKTQFESVRRFFCSQDKANSS